MMLLFCMVQVANGQSLVIEHVAIVDVQEKRILQDHFIEIVDGRISSMGPMTKPLAENQQTRIDASGQFAYPSLFDCHVHLNEPERDSLLMIANGVLFARDMGGTTAKRLALRAKARRGDLHGLGLSVTGTILDGKPPYHSWATECDTPEKGRQAVQALHKDGVDQIKVYTQLKADVYRAIAEEAKRLDIDMVGHVPDSVTLSEAAAAGQRSVEHFSRVETLLEEQHPDKSLKAKREGAFASGIWFVYPGLSQEQRRTSFARLAESRVAQCPTLVLLLGQARIAPDERTQIAWAKFSAVNEKRWWQTEIPSQWMTYGESLRASLPIMLEALRDMHESKVPLLVGTDLGNLGVLSGYSVHHEMRLWQEAGIPSADVLRYATLEPARFLKQDNDFGSIEVGKGANIVLATKNPLEDVTNAAAIQSVIVNGKYLDRENLDAMLESAAGEFQSKQSEDVSKEELSLGGDSVEQGTLGYTYQQWSNGGERYRIDISDKAGAFESIVDFAGWDSPLRVSGAVDGDGRVVSLRYRSFTKLPVVVEVEVADNHAKVKTVLGTKTVSETDLAVESNDVFMASWASIGMQWKRFDLAMGESTPIRVWNWNASSREFDIQTCKLTRKDDEELDWNSKKTQCSTFVWTTLPPWDRVAHKLWISKEGRLLRAIRQEGTESRTVTANP
jgi:pimeloyl-ACP methyl ester carboxylesterase